MLGFIGAGAMGSAILRGILATQKIKPEKIRFTRAHHESALALSKELGVKHAKSNNALINEIGTDSIAILGVKPHLCTAVLTEIAEQAEQQKTLIVSLAAGISLSQLAATLAPNQPIIRAMPNVAGSIGKGMTALCPNENVNESRLAAVRNIFETIGAVSIISEKDFPAFTAIAGSSPAWTFTYIDALSRAALAAGMPKAQALEIAAQAVSGAAQLALAKLPDTRPQALVDTVTSPGGTTVAGLIAMEEAGFSNAVIRAVKAAIERDHQLG